MLSTCSVYAHLSSLSNPLFLSAVRNLLRYVSGIHSNAEKFDPRAEEVFKFVQVFTAICDSFAHGANDVANAVGPLSTIYFVYKDGAVSSEADTGSASCEC